MTDTALHPDCYAPLADTVGLPIPRTAENPRELPATMRVHLTYWWRHRRALSLRAPNTFTALIQHRKLFDRNPRFPRLIDKVAVKSFVAKEVGESWVTPTLWQGTELPQHMPLARPFVVKSRHGCNQIRFVRTGLEDWTSIRRDAERWMRSAYGHWLDEWGYLGVPRGLLIEPFVGCGKHLPVDYKFYVFQGRVEAIQVHLDRETDHRWLLYDRSWQPLSAVRPGDGPSRPSILAQMIEGAEALAHDIDFVRVDLYDLGGKPRFGEMSFYPGSGLDPFDPISLDAMLGRCWLDPGVAGRATLADRSSIDE